MPRLNDDAEEAVAGSSESANTTRLPEATDLTSSAFPLHQIQTIETISSSIPPAEDEAAAKAQGGADADDSMTEGRLPATNEEDKQAVVSESSAQPALEHPVDSKAPDVPGSMAPPVLIPVRATESASTPTPVLESTPIKEPEPGLVSGPVPVPVPVPELKQPAGQDRAHEHELANNLELELAPLPTSFDPDAEPVSSPAAQIIYKLNSDSTLRSDSDVNSDADADPFGIRATSQRPGQDSNVEEEDEDRLETGEGQPDMDVDGGDQAGGDQEGEEEEDDEGRMMEYITSLQRYDGDENEEEEGDTIVVGGEADVGGDQGAETEGAADASASSEDKVSEAVNQDGNENASKEMNTEQPESEGGVKSTERLPEKEATKDTDVDTEMPSARSSPLTPVSDIPELPDTLSLSPLEPLNPLPLTSSFSPPRHTAEMPRDTARAAVAQIPHAESSAAAARRASTSPRPPPSMSVLPVSARLSTISAPTKAGVKRPRPTEGRTGMPKGTKDLNGRVRGKGQEKVVGQDGSGGGVVKMVDVDDDLASISDKDELREIDDNDEHKEKEVGKSQGKERNDEKDQEKDDGDGKRGSKKAKGINGKAIKAPGSRKKLDATSGIRTSARPPEKITPRPKALTDAAIRKLLSGKTREVQLSSCQRPRYNKWGKCTQCIAKVGGDSCRFRDYRTFEIDPETTEIKRWGWFESTEWKDDMTPLPTEFNKRLEEEHMIRTERTVAAMLLPLITTELRHIVSKKTITRGMDAAKHRAVCDFCSSTIFGGWFFCKTCGRDYCLHCERYFPDSLETITQSPWPLPDAARPRLLRCHHIVQPGNHQPKNPAFHGRTDLQPVSRFTEDELRDHWLKLAQFVLEGEEGLETRLNLMGLSEDDEVDKVLKDFPTLSAPASIIDPTLTSTAEDGKPQEGREFKYTKSTHPSAIPIPDPANLEKESREFLFADINDLTNEVFDVMWSKGEPMVVDGVGKRLNLDWKPDSFIERFGPEPCFVVDCQSNKPQATTVAKFFEQFKDSEGRGKGILKLKDWPSTDDFQNTHPDLYNDFCDALPVPDFTRREGVLNLYAHFPPGPTRPDIGPKMYNAFEAVESTGGFGSTRLHMDVADAINLLTYASIRGDDQPGCAVWDLFRAEDADLIREFLREKFGQTHMFTDPIHSQLFYLDASLRRELFEKKGVRGWRIYQYPGQTVFIPAGCAHQVCNLADCIKIALDFVSPHNVRRCQQLTQDFRKENFVKVWKDDVLQLYNVLWYAWLSCQETRQRRIREAKEEELALAAREAHLAGLRRGRHNPYEYDYDFDRPGFGRIGSPIAPSSAIGGGTGVGNGIGASIGSGIGMSASAGGGGFGLGGWNVSSVRDEPHTTSRSPSVSASVSRGGSPTLARVLADRAVRNGDDPARGDEFELGDKGDGEVERHNNHTKKQDDDEDMSKGSDVKEKEDKGENAEEGKEPQRKGEDEAKSKRRLAESLLSITLTKEAPAPYEVFLPSSALWSNKKPIVVPPPRAGSGNGNGNGNDSSKSNNTGHSTRSSIPGASSNSLTSTPGATTTAGQGSIRNTSRQLALVARQRAAEKKEAERLERKAKNPPRELRTSTLIKLGAKKLEDVLDMARGQMGGPIGLDSGPGGLPLTSGEGEGEGTSGVDGDGVVSRTGSENGEKGAARESMLDIGKEAWSRLASVSASARASASPRPAPSAVPDLNVSLEAQNDHGSGQAHAHAIANANESGHGHAQSLEDPYDALDSPMTIDMEMEMDDLASLRALAAEINRDEQEQDQDNEGVYGFLGGEEDTDVHGGPLDPDTLAANEKDEDEGAGVDNVGNIQRAGGVSSGETEAEAGEGGEAEDRDTGADVEDEAEDEGARRELAAQLSMLQQTEDMDMEMDLNMDMDMEMGMTEE